MRYLILTDCFYPENKSVSRHIYDLSMELTKKKNQVSIFCRKNNNKKLNLILPKNISVHFIKIINIKNLPFILRGLVELFMPFLFYKEIKKKIDSVDNIIIYSPSIFFGLIFKNLKKRFNCKIILLLRDIFPDWAKQIGIFHNFSVYYYFLKFIANFQYQNSDVACLQSKKDLKIISKFYNFKKKKIILYNWIYKKNIYKLKNNIQKIKKFKVVFGGTIGPVQNWNNIIYLIKASHEKKLGVIFYFVGDGYFKNKLKKEINKYNLRNVRFYKSMTEEKFLSFLKYCDMGILSLNKKILFDNFPGKFFSYLEANIPILADINKNHELSKIIKKYNLGKISDPENQIDLLNNLKKTMKHKYNQKALRKNYTKIYKKMFSAKEACKKISNC